MDSFEFNKIAAAVLIVALLLIGLNQIADFIYQVKKPQTPGYKVEGVVEEAKTASKDEIKKVEKLADIKVLLASANIGAGENTFRQNRKTNPWSKIFSVKNILGFSKIFSFPTI